MEPTVVESCARAGGNDATPLQSSCVERLLRMGDGRIEEAEKSIAVIDDEALQALSSRIVRVQEALHSETELRNRIPSETVDKLKQNQLPTRIKLNVGGKVFATSLSTLTSVKGTFFESMFGGRWPLKPEPDGTFSIGRDPKGFSMVLQFLHGVTISHTSVPPCDMDAFIEDVDYYGLPVELVEQWLGRKLRFPEERLSSEDHSEGNEVIENGMAVTQTKHGQSWVLGVLTYGGEDHVRISMRIDALGMNEWLLVGVIGQRPVADPANQPSSYGFSSHRTNRVAGTITTWNSPLSFKTGDLIELEIDCKHSMLTVRNTTNNTADSTELPAGKQWRMLVCINCRDTCIRILDSRLIQ